MFLLDWSERAATPTGGQQDVGHEGVATRCGASSLRSLWANETSQRTRSGGEGSSLTRWKVSALQRKSQRQLSYDVIYLKSELKYKNVSQYLVSLNRRRWIINGLDAKRHTILFSKKTIIKSIK
ncbi:hypothetical protein PB01_14655 [Psychrobacillus glaciei]|uniref:Uncharacterized protein n=1 Tax=Psychrobacillus glaciei TaxID=2283160 RepID=A0A5J6SQL7_9BACI|nr:hypothetical protein PB01_14655 [Psychrobacillus glaciei]